MASGDVAVAHSGDTLSRKSSAPSRRSILARIAPGSELQSPVSNTDAVLRSRRDSTSESNNSDSMRRKAGKQSGEQSTPNYLAVPDDADG